jgi:hypothetical protein
LSEGLVGQPQQPQQPQQPPPPLPQQEQPPMSAPPATERVGLVDDSVEAAAAPTASVVPTAVAVPMLNSQAAEAPMAAGVTAAGQQEPTAGRRRTGAATTMEEQGCSDPSRAATAPCANIPLGRG